MTMENWNTLFIVALNTPTNNIITLVYFTSWLVLGNYVLFNLVMAVLIDGFTNTETC
jgi:hypothetical protein